MPDDGPLFKSHAAQFLQISMERNELGRRIRGNNCIQRNEDLDDRIRLFKIKFKDPFLHSLKNKIDLAFQIGDVLLSLDVFNFHYKFSDDEVKDKMAT